MQRPTHSPKYYQKWAPDLYRDPVHRWIDTYHIIFPILLFVGLYAAGGMSWLVWGGFVRSVFVLHSTWLVNSATHMWGYRSHPTRDDSTNLWWVALLTYGEGWHNNHHAFQTSARHGLRWWEVDMTYIAIWTMKVCRIAYNIKLVKLPRRRSRRWRRRWRRPSDRPVRSRTSLRGASRLVIAAASGEDGRALIKRP